MKKITVSVRVSPEDRERLGELAKLLGRQLGAEVSMGQAFVVAVKEAIEKRKEYERVSNAN